MVTGTTNTGASTQVLTAAISFTKLAESNGVYLYSDKNNLQYFAFDDSEGAQLVQDPDGGVRGYQKISAGPKIIVCDTGRGNAVFLRKSMRWLEVPSANQPYDSFGTVVRVTEDLLQIHMVESNNTTILVYLFEKGRFVPSVADDSIVGRFKLCGDVVLFRTQRALMLTPVLSDEKTPLMAAYLIDDEEYVEVPRLVRHSQGGWGMVNVFHFLTDAYAVMKYGTEKIPEYYVYAFERREYMDMSGYFSPGKHVRAIECTPKYLIVGGSEAESNVVAWMVVDAATWEWVSHEFKYMVETSLFDQVEILEGNVVVVRKNVSVRLDGMISE